MKINNNTIKKAKALTDKGITTISELVRYISQNFEYSEHRYTQNNEIVEFEVYNKKYNSLEEVLKLIFKYKYQTDLDNRGFMKSNLEDYIRKAKIEDVNVLFTRQKAGKILFLSSDNYENLLKLTEQAGFFFGLGGTPIQQELKANFNSF